MKYLLPLFAIFLWSCSPNNQSGNSNGDKPQVEEASTSTVVEFGSLKITDSQKLASATIYNDTGSNLNGPATLSTSDFAFVSGFNCTAGAKNKTSCSTIKLTFTPAGKNPGEYNATLNLGAISVPVHATIESPAVPTVSVSSSLGSDIDFGSFLSTTNSAITKTIAITNKGTASITGVISLTGSNYLKTYDTCNGSTIAKSATCQIKISFNPYNKAAGNLNEILTVNGMVINLSATVSTPESIAQGGQPVVIGGVTYASDVKFYNGTSVITDYSYPTGVVLLTTTIKNSGNVAAIASSAVLSNTNNFSFSVNNCNNAALAVNASCQMKINFSSATVGTFTSNLTFGSKVLTLTATKGCSTGFHVEGNICVADSFTYEPVYSNYGTCSTANACQGSGTQNRTIAACNKLSNGVVVGTADVSNCSAYNTLGYLQQSCQSPEGDKTITITNGSQVIHCTAGSTVPQSIVSTTCSSGFNNQNNSCVSDSITYTANYSQYGTCSANACDGSGLKNRTITSCQKLRNGIPEAGGQISDCAAFNIVSNLQATCDSPAGNKTINITNGIQVIQCAAGSTTTQAIVSTTCSIGFNSQNSACVVDEISYTPNYSVYGSCSAINACDGQGLKNRTISSCQKLRNGVPEAGGLVSDCSTFSVPANLQQTCDSPAGNKTLDISNGQQVIQCSAGSLVAQSIISTFCNPGFHSENNSCVADVITYTANYSAYGTCSAPNACDGQGLKLRTIDSCQKLRNEIPEAGGQVSDCTAFNISSNLQATCDSPAGNKTIDISNGQQVIQCSVGSLVAQSILSTTCSVGFNNQNNICVADVITYTANYSTYGSCSASNTCDGQGLKNRMISSCQKFRNGIPESGGQIIDCAAFNISSNLQATCDSPAGNKTVAIQNGDQTVSCPTGSTVQTLVSTSCNPGFNNQNNVCVADVITYTASYSVYGSCSAANACDGQGLKNRTISSCQKLRNGIPESGGQISDCAAFNISSNLQLTCDSPAGNKIVRILNGDQTVSCPTGSTVQTIVSTACDSNYTLVNGVCSSAGYSTGFKMLSDVNLGGSSTTTKNECGFTVSGMEGDYTLAVRRSINTNFSTATSITSNNTTSTGCQYSVINQLKTSFSVQQRDTGSSVICSISGYGYELSYDRYFNDFGGNCTSLQFLPNTLSSRTVRSISTTVDTTIASASPTMFVGVGDELYFTKTQSGKSILGKIPFPANDLTSTAQNATLYSNIEADYASLFNLQGKVLIKTNNTYSTFNPATGTTTAAVIDCLPNCSAFNSAFLLNNNDVIFTMYYGATNTKYIYKTSDGVTFNLLTQVVQDDFPMSSIYQEYNGYIYYNVSATKLLVRLNLTTGVIESLGITAVAPAQVGNQLFVFANDGKIYKVNSSNTLVQIASGYVTTTIWRGPNTALFTITNGTVLDLYQINTAGTIQLIYPGAYTKDSSSTTVCYNTNEAAFINPLTGALITSCYRANPGTYTMRMFKMNGEIVDVSSTNSRLLDGNASDYNPINYNDTRNKIAMPYKGKLYLKATINNVIKLVTVDSSDNWEISTFNSGSTNTLSGSNTRMIIYKDNLIFGANPGLSTAICPAAEQEIYKFYSP